MMRFVSFSHKFLLGVFLCICFVFGIFFGTAYLEKNIFPEYLEVVFLQIDRGDSIYILTPHKKEILIDGGQNISTVQELERFRPFWDRHIDMLIMTHPDSDHYYGFLDILTRFSVDTLFLTGAKKDDPKYQRIFTLAKEKNIQILFADKTSDFEVDGVDFNVLSPLSSVVGTSLGDDNDYSLVIKMNYEGKSILFTGDIEKKSEERLLASGQNIQADVLKVPHHGSKSSSSEHFLKAVNPDFAVFTTGIKNVFGHPHNITLDRYYDVHIPFVNSRDGSVVMSVENGEMSFFQNEKRVFLPQEKTP